MAFSAAAHVRCYPLNAMKGHGGEIRDFDQRGSEGKRLLAPSLTKVS
jgi:hypothetical protein